MSAVFISYKSEEKETAQRIRGALSLALGCNVWWDQQLQTGGRWSEDIDKALSEAACVVVLWSSKSTESQWVQMEAAVAKATDKLAPARIEACKIPEPYSQFQCANLENWDGNETHPEFQNLTKRVHYLLSRAAGSKQNRIFAAHQRWQDRHPTGLGIGLIGADGTGKTTLVTNLRQRYPDLDVRYSQEIARNVIAKGYPLGKDASPESYLVLIHDHLVALDHMRNNRTPFISGRTILDPLCYARVNKTLPRPAVSDNLIELMHKLWLFEQDYYALYLYFPIEFEKIEDDGIRVVDRSYQIKIDREFQQLIENNDIPVVTVRGSAEDRLSTVMKALSRIVHAKAL